ncbi:MAG TPA: FKBP-type peptidyl-prolyl cis-trans isomerase [Myxococcaceae bacterium]|nr:FKBP-type peptidyl-prolyl cis-trans isomerase [Myxococcaceae bacterium]
MVSRASLTIFGISAVVMVLLLPVLVKVWPRAAGATVHSSAILVWFKVDPRVADPTHSGTRWLSQDAYFGANAQDTVEARAQGLDAKGHLFAISPDWIASDPEMVTVSPSRGEYVRIVVKHPGESNLRIVAGEISSEWVVQAKYLGSFIQLAITRATARGSSPSPATAATSVPFPNAAETAEVAARKAKALAENKKKDGKLTLPSGIEYRVIQRGEGRTPSHDDVVEAHYRITLMDGTELANSFASGKPTTITVARAISGLREALELMPVGSRWQLFLPRQLGGGGRRGHDHRGNATPARVLEVQLLSIQPTAGAGQRMAADTAQPDDNRN